MSASTTSEDVAGPRNPVAPIEIVKSALPIPQHCGMLEVSWKQTMAKAPFYTSWTSSLLNVESRSW